MFKVNDVSDISSIIHTTANKMQYTCTMNNCLFIYHLHVAKNMHCFLKFIMIHCRLVIKKTKTTPIKTFPFLMTSTNNMHLGFSVLLL